MSKGDQQDPYNAHIRRYEFDVIYTIGGTGGTNVYYKLPVIAHDTRNAIEVADSIYQASKYDYANAYKLNVVNVIRGKEVSST